MNQPQLVGQKDAETYPEIVVAYKHLGRVKAALRDLGIDFSEPFPPDVDLGLGLIRLADHEAAAQALEDCDQKPWKDVQAAAKSRPDPERDSSEFLDGFIRGLHGYFARRYAGWSPVFGKNRILGHVNGTQGKVRHGGGGYELESSTEAPGPRKGERGTGVVVGVIDTSVADHPWLGDDWTLTKGEVFRPVTRLRNTTNIKRADPNDYPNAAAGHATFVVGMILKQAPGCVVRVLPVLSSDGTASSWEVAKAIVEMARTKPDVINLALVCYTEDGEPPLALATAIDRVGRDTVVVAAAGNHGDLGDAKKRPLTRKQVQVLISELTDEERAEAKKQRIGLELAARRKASRTPGWPAAFPQVVAVGSGSDDDEPAAFSPPDVSWIDVMTQGDEVVSTYPSGFYSVVTRDARGREKSHVTRMPTAFAKWGGTSFAAAKISGKIAARTMPGRMSAREVVESYVPSVTEGRVFRKGEPEMPPYIATD